MQLAYSLSLAAQVHRLATSISAQESERQAATARRTAFGEKVRQGKATAFGIAIAQRRQRVLIALGDGKRHQVADVCAKCKELTRGQVRTVLEALATEGRVAVQRNRRVTYRLA